MRARAPLVLLLSTMTLVTARGAAQDACHDDAAVRVTAVGESDRATADAITTLLAPGNPATPSWEVVIAGPRTVVRHVDSAEHFARTLAPESTPYDRALASIELLNAGRAAACGSEVAIGVETETETESETETDAGPAPAPSARSETSFGVMAGVRFDADPDGPWMLRPTLGLDVGLLRGGAVHLALGLQASGFGVFARDAEQADVEVRYERHDIALELGGALALDALTLSARLSVGVTLRDVSALDGDVSRAHRLDAGATVGAVIALRVPLVGPLGLRLSGELIGIPSPITYRVAGQRVVTESELRLAGSFGLDLEF